MAVTAIFNHIGSKLKSANPWIDNYAVNAIQLPNKSDGSKGEIVNFVGEEKEYLGLDDTKGSAFYIRTNPVFTYIQQRQLTSCTPDSEVTIQFKFVFFAINQPENYDPLKIENKFSNDLRQMNFGDYFGTERKLRLIVKKSNSDAFGVFTEEIGKKYQFGANSVFVSIEAELKFLSSNECEDCGILVSENILNNINFCDPEVIASLTFKQKECLEEEFGNEFTCEDVNNCLGISDSGDEDLFLNEKGEFVSAGGSGGTGTAIKNNFIAGENLGAQRVVMISGGLAFYFDPTNQNNVGKQIGITAGSAISGASVSVICAGVMSGFSILVPDSIYYIGGNGTISTTIPTTGIDFRVGVAIDSDTLQIEFSEQCVLI